MQRKQAMFVALLCAVSTVISTSALRSMDLAGELGPPTELRQNGGESLLFALLQWLFSLFGVSNPDLGISAGASEIFQILFTLFRLLKPYLIPITVVAVILIALGLATRQIATDVYTVIETTNDEETEYDEFEFRFEAVSNEVCRTWGEMVQQLDAENARSRTPAEWAEIAREAGFDSKFVNDITDTFQAVRYGDEPVTSEQYRWDQRDLKKSEGEE